MTDYDQWSRDPGRHDHEQTWTCDACGTVHVHRCQEPPAPLAGRGSTDVGRAAARALYATTRAARQETDRGTR